MRAIDCVPVSICCLILLCGCQTASQGPVYKLHAAHEQSISAPLAISVTDKRPANEQKYQPGSIQPVDYQRGIETLSLENFEPLVTDLLQQACLKQLSSLKSAPVWADIEVRRFRVVVDRREILAAEYDRQLEAEEVAPVVGLGVGLGQGGGMTGIVGGVGSGLVSAAVAANKRKELDQHRTAWKHAEPGVTCDIELRVHLHWPDGNRDEFDIQAQSHSLTPYGDFQHSLNEIKWNIPPAVETAISQASTKLRQEVESRMTVDQAGNPNDEIRMTKE